MGFGMVEKCDVGVGDRDMGRWDAINNYSRWGSEKLNLKMIQEMMSEKGVVEPLGSWFGLFLWSISCFLPFLILPWYDEEGAEQKLTGALPAYAAR